jgi:capsular exopolysaccharide synthesis family protein
MKSLSDDRIKTYKYLEEKCKNTLLGYIPHFEKSFDEEGMQIPDLMTSESFRVVRDNLKFMVTDPASQVICVTSHSDEDGKSTVVTHLAESFSHGEQRVIVLDLDMQNPTMHQKFHLFNDDGMSTVLSHRAMISNAIEYTTNENLDIVTAGSPPPNPWELIRSQRMLDVIKKLKNVYDIIIIDTPSVCIDKERAKALAFADVTLYVLRANVTKKDIINDLDSFALLLNDVR